MRKQKFQKSELKHKNRTNNNKPMNCQDSNGGQLLPYKIQKSEDIGRYLVATRDLPAGEIVLSDEPLVVGPCQEAKPLCIGCYIDINLKNPQTYQRNCRLHLSLIKLHEIYHFRCKICGWPLCASKCSGYHEKNGHDKEECNIFSKSEIKNKEISDFEGFYYAITPFRCLLLKNRNPENWKILCRMESHTEERKKSARLWEMNDKMAVAVIRNIWGVTEFSKEEIHFACGVLEVNAFEINSSSGMQCLQAVYPNAFLLAHDCLPNTRRSNGQDFKIIIRTLRTIRANDMITVSYAYVLQSTFMRRKHLKQTKFFFCSCKRCSDPTEFGTYIGALKCLSCKAGFLLPEKPLDENSLWKCTSHKCKNQMEVSQIIPILDRLFQELDLIEGNDIVGYEKFVKKCTKIFHDNHYLSLSAMHCLSQLYGKINGYLINNLTDEQLERKEEICRKLIKIFEKLEPGQSKQRGILLYELQAPLMVLLKRRFQNISKKEAKSKIKEVLKYLDEAFLILSKEPDCSAEGHMATAAKQAMIPLREWLNLLN